MCFLISLVGCVLHILRWLTFRLLQDFLTCRDNFIYSMFYVRRNIHYLLMFHISLYVVCIHSVRKGKFLCTFAPTSQNIIHIGLITIWIYLMRASAGWWLEWIRNFIPVSIWTYHKSFAKFSLIFDHKSAYQLIYVIYVLAGFNHLLMVITHTSNVLVLCFPYISNKEFISWELLLHRYE